MLNTGSTTIETGTIFKSLTFSLKVQKIMFFFLNTQESVIHRALFWVAIAILQLDDSTLYAAGMALIEQNLHTLNSQGAFDKNVSFSLYGKIFVYV